MINFSDNDIVFLLGAGASADADIPTSTKMISEIEFLIKDDSQWKLYNDIYHYMKSSLIYSEGIKGQFENILNIEQLVNSLSELEKKDEHVIYPFIGNWNMKLVEVGGSDFARLHEFKELILEKLKKWVTKEDYRIASYYSELIAFQREINSRLHIFSLNYDLCIEYNCRSIKIERGFDENTRKWDWRLFDESNPAGELVKIYLYKLHGSIDWNRTHTGDIMFSDEVAQIDKPHLIFGTDYKLQYLDPYLFLMYQFRRRCLDSKLIVTIGYGFGDEHINGIIGQALSSKSNIKLFSVGLDINKKNVIKTLNSQVPDVNFEDKVAVKDQKAKKFFENELNLKTFGQLFPISDENEPF